MMLRARPIRGGFGLTDVIIAVVLLGLLAGPLLVPVKMQARTTQRTHLLMSARQLAEAALQNLQRRGYATIRTSFPAGGTWISGVSNPAGQPLVNPRLGTSVQSRAVYLGLGFNRQVELTWGIPTWVPGYAAPQLVRGYRVRVRVWTRDGSLGQTGAGGTRGYEVSTIIACLAGGCP